MARKPKEFDKSQFEKLCSIQCTQEEMCYFFNTTEKTISKWCKREYDMDFSQCIKRFGVNGKMSLRRMQFKSAERGNVSMLIWLGKQYLGQRDKTESTNTHEIEDLSTLKDLLK